MTLNTSDPAGSRSCMSGPYVCLCGGLHAEPLYMQPTEAKPVVGLVSRQAITSPKLGHFLVITATRAQYLVQWKDIVGVRIVFLERGWRGGGNGTRPCCTKRIIKTKQLWQVWNLRTLPGRHEDYQSHTVCWRGGSLLYCAPLWMWWTGQKIQSFTWTQKADTWQKSSSQGDSHQCTQNKSSISFSACFRATQRIDKLAWAIILCRARKDCCVFIYKGKSVFCCCHINLWCLPIVRLKSVK